MGSCSSTPDPSAASPGDNLDVKTKDRSGAVPKAVNYQFKLALIGDSTFLASPELSMAPLPKRRPKSETCLFFPSRAIYP